MLISLIGGIWQNLSKQKKEAEARRQTAQTIQPKEQRVEQQFNWEEDQEVVTERDKRAAERLAQMERAAQEAKKGRRIKRRSMFDEKEAMEDEPLHGVNLKDFDARKAVIYSEILNPPYL